jgi:AcrR family transcriptional regulator
MNISHGRVNQKQRTYNGILRAAAEVMRTGREVTMSEIAKVALVSEATAYRYFPDLTTLLQKVLTEQMVAMTGDLPVIENETKPVERVAVATEYLLRHVLTYQSAVRATIAATITLPSEPVTIRPALRFRLIDQALAPLVDTLDAGVLAQLKRDLAIVVSAEALFNLMDFRDVPSEEAIRSIIHTARLITHATLSATKAS